MRQRLATLTRSRAGPVQNGLRSSVTKPRRRSGSAPQNFRLRSKRNSGAALTAAAGNETRRAHPRDAIHETLLTRGIGCRFSAAGSREQSSEQPLQGNERRKDKGDDAGEGDGKVKVMHDDQRLLQTAAACKTSPCIVCQSGRTSAPRRPRALQTKLGPISDSLMSSVG